VVIVFFATSEFNRHSGHNFEFYRLAVASSGIAVPPFSMEMVAPVLITVIFAGVPATHITN